LDPLAKVAIPLVDEIQGYQAATGEIFPELTVAWCV